MKYLEDEDCPGLDIEGDESFQAYVNDVGT